MALDKEITLVFDEGVQGWSSFQTYVPDSGLSLNNRFFTFKRGVIWEHHIDDVPRNEFYDAVNPSMVQVVFNDDPSSVKNFKTLGYEGDGEWEATISTDQESIISDPLAIPVSRTLSGSVNADEFVDREGKKFGWIRGQKKDVNDIDIRSNSVQGLGTVTVVPTIALNIGIDGTPRVSIDDVASAIDTTRNIGIDGAASFVRIPNVETDAEGTIWVNSRNVVLNGDLVTDYNLTITEKGFRYGTDSTLSTYETLTVPGTSLGTFTAPLEVATELTTIYFQAYATNGSGTGLGVIDSFVTPMFIGPVVTIQETFNADQTQVSLATTVTDADTFSGNVFTYQWYLNGQILHGSTNSTLISLATGGTYSVIVTDSDGQTGTAEYVFVPNTLPVVTFVISEDQVSPNADAMAVIGASDTTDPDGLLGSTFTLVRVGDTTNTNILDDASNAGAVATLIANGSVTVTLPSVPGGIQEYTVTMTDSQGGIATATDSISSSNTPVLVLTEMLINGNTEARVTASITDPDQPVGTPHDLVWTEILENVGIDGAAEYDVDVAEITSFTYAGGDIPGSAGGDVTFNVVSTGTPVYTITAVDEDGAQVATSTTNVVTIPGQAGGASARTLTFSITPGASTAFDYPATVDDIDIDQGAGTVTVTFNITSTGLASGTSLTDTTTPITRTGIPGQTITGFTRTVTDNVSTRLESVGCSVTGAPAETVDCEVDGFVATFGGVFPDTDTTVTAAVTSTATPLIGIAVEFTQVSGGSGAGGVSYPAGEQNFGSWSATARLTSSDGSAIPSGTVRINANFTGCTGGTAAGEAGVAFDVQSSSVTSGNTHGFSGTF